MSGPLPPDCAPPPTRIAAPGRRVAAAYRIAGHVLRVVDPPPALAAFQVEGAGEETIEVGVEGVGGGEPPTRTVGWLGSRAREVSCHALPGGFHVRVEAAGAYVVQEGGRVVAPVPPRIADEALYEEAFLGPPLLLALALRGTYCLHASAVARDGAALAILGDSGEGKSTLARWLAERGAGWTRLTDDITPVAIEKDAARLFPAFPQLKVAERLVWPAPSVPIRGWVRLAPSDAAEPWLEPLRPSEWLVELQHALAGARLFPHALATRAFDLCGDLAQLVPGYRLHSPRRWEALPRTEMLLAGLGTEQDVDGGRD